MSVAGTLGLPAGASLTISLSLDQQRALSWAIAAALDDRAHYLKYADPDVDHGVEWPEVAVGNGTHLDNLASICEQLTKFGTADDCRRLAAEFREAVETEPDDLCDASESDKV